MRPQRPPGTPPEDPPDEARSARPGVVADAGATAPVTSDRIAKLTEFAAKARVSAGVVDAGVALEPPQSPEPRRSLIPSDARRGSESVVDCPATDTAPPAAILTSTPASGVEPPAVPSWGEMLLEQKVERPPVPSLGELFLEQKIERPATPSLGAMLLERKLITSDQLRQAMERQKRTRRRLGRVLVELGFATPEAVLEALSAQLGVPSTRVNSYTVNPDAVQCLSEKVARKYTAFPLLKVGSTLVVAIASPTDLHALDDIRFASGCGIQMMVAMETEIQTALDKYYGNTFGPNDADEVGTIVIDIPGPQLDLHDEVAERSAVSLVDRIIAKAAADRASDIHLEPTKNSLRVRYRIDGTFSDIAQLLQALAPAVLARIKVLSGMDITEHRLPQDGRFSATVGGRGLDVRTSTYPTIWGEKAVLRLLDRTALQLSIDGLMPSPCLEEFRALINRPEGILLVTGPTGSGKTSTLYAALAEIAEQGKNIITIEDPVEYWLPGVNQGQTNHKAGFTFARGMRAILRQDPDVIMVGEIRDSETLETAIEAALTGHLVMSTLHTNSAVATVTLVRAIVTMAKALHFYVVAEGVETEAEFAVVKSLECDAVQGYFIHARMPPEKIPQAMAQR